MIRVICSCLTPDTYGSLPQTSSQDIQLVSPLAETSAQAFEAALAAIKKVHDPAYVEVR